MRVSKLELAILCHENNRVYCRALGDDSQPSWEAAPVWQKETVYQGVLFHLHNPDATPESSHESWMEQKRRDGWTYGPVKDPAKKEHPCFRPYNELPIEQRVKDHLFKGMIDHFRSHVYDFSDRT